MKPCLATVFLQAVSVVLLPEIQMGRYLRKVTVAIERGVFRWCAVLLAHGGRVGGH